MELLTQDFYFAFQVIQLFLVVTLASAATEIIAIVFKDPSSLATVLARKIPQTANFYMSYILLQGLSFSPSALLQTLRLVLDRTLGRVVDDTPRKLYLRQTDLPDLPWGSHYPTFTFLTVIGTLG